MRSSRSSTSAAVPPKPTRRLRSLTSPEPNLHVRVGPPGRHGRVRLRVEITPDPAVQGHWFETEIDQGQLPPAILQLERVLERFPVRGLPVAIRDEP